MRRMNSRARRLGDECAWHVGWGVRGRQVGATGVTLWAEFLTNEGRTIHKWTHYFPVYESHFGRYVNRPMTLLEIGCGRGGSLQMWKRYLGPFAQIVGIDIAAECRAYEEDQIAVRIGDQGDTGFLDAILAEFGPPDIIVDDGSHMMRHVRASFAHLYPRMSATGVYLVEDLHTAYSPQFEGGLHSENSFIELCKGLIDELNADHAGEALAPTAFTRSTLSMHFYDSVAVFERGRHLKKHAPQIGRDFTSVLPVTGKAFAEAGHAAGEVWRRLAFAEAQRATALQWVAALESSTSWRMTAPLRVLAGALRRVTGQRDDPQRQQGVRTHSS